MMIRRCFAWTICLTFCSTPVFAQDDYAELDTVKIVGGGHVAGKLVSKKDSGIVLSLDNDIGLFLPKARVQQIKAAATREEYRRLATAAGKDPDLHYKLAIWCKANQLYPQRQFHMQRAIALDENHERARAALGYVKDNQTREWILYEQQQRARGLVFSDGSWQLPEAVARKRFQREANIAAKKWIKDIARLKGIVNRNNSKSEEALAELKAIKDPNAAGAVAKQLVDSRDGSQSQAVRLMWVRLLGRFRNSISVQTLVACGLEEPDDVIREAAMEQLAEYGASSAVATYLPIIKSDKHSSQLVRRALRGLSYFPDRELWASYIDGLITKHKQKVAAGPAIQAGQVNGQGGLQMGRKQEPKPIEVRNAGALTLLKMIEPGVDYNYDEQAWREHFARQLTTYEGDLRRDP